MAKAKEYRWKILLPGLVSQAKLQGSVNLVENERVDKFTEEKFHQYLLKFIVANDQVCINLSIFLPMLHLPPESLSMLSSAPNSGLCCFYFVTI